MTVINTQRQSIGITRFICAVVLGLSTLTRAIAQDDAANPIERRAAATLQQASRSAKAQRIAFERFQFARWYASKRGDWPISRMIGDYTHSLLFPIGRSDRAYVLLFPDWHGKPESKAVCYQKEDGKYKLVYGVSLEETDRVGTRAKPAKKTEQYASILGYLTSEDSGHLGSVEHSRSHRVIGSKFAKSDLAIKRDYVVYDYDSVIDTLDVSLLSEPQGGDSGEQYFLGENPLTKQKLNEGKYLKGNGGKELEITNGEQEFFKKFGLPVTRKELKLFSK